MGLTDTQKMEVLVQLLHSTVTVQSNVLLVADRYIKAMQEELGHQGTDCLDGHNLSKEWDRAVLELTAHSKQMAATLKSEDLKAT